MLPELLRELFFVENYNITPEYNWVYAIISLLIALQVYIIYYFSIDRIKSSTYGLSQLLDLKYPKKLISGIKLYFLSILSIPILNIISNLSGLILDDSSLKIGFNTVLGIFVLVFLIHGLYRLINELFDIDDLPHNRFINNYSKIHLLFSSILIIISFVNVIIDETYLNHLIILLAIIYLLVTAIIMEKLKKISWIREPNPVRKARFRIIILNYYIIILTLVVEFIIRLQSKNSDLWLEELGILFDGIVILLVFNFYLVIFLPETLRKIIKISNQELSFYKDVRIDENPNIFKWYQLSLDISKIQESEILHRSNFVVFHSFMDKTSSQVCKALMSTFSTHYAMDPSGYSEDFFNKEILPKHNLFFLLDPADPFTQKILHRIYLDYNFRIEFRPGLCINNFEYVESEAKYIPFFISPLVNLNTGITIDNNLKSWTIIAEEKHHNIISEFINNYYSYFQGISKEYVVICILKFPLVDGQITNIPSGRKINWPDFNYLIFL